MLGGRAIVVALLPVFMVLPGSVARAACSLSTDPPTPPSETSAFGGDVSFSINANVSCSGLLSSAFVCVRARREQLAGTIDFSNDGTNIPYTAMVGADVLTDTYQIVSRSGVNLFSANFDFQVDYFVESEDYAGFPDGEYDAQLSVEFEGVLNIFSCPLSTD